MINKAYYEQATIKTLQQLFAQDKTMPSITCSSFLTPESYAKTVSQVSSSSFKKKSSLLSHSYYETVFHAFFEKELAVFVSSIVRKNVTLHNGKLMLFSWKDYTLLHDTAHFEGVYDIIFDMTHAWPSNTGGSLIYSNGQGENRTILPQKNALYIVQRKKFMRYIEYCNHYATQRLFCLWTGQ